MTTVARNCASGAWSVCLSFLREGTRQREAFKAVENPHVQSDEDLHELSPRKPQKSGKGLTVRGREERRQ